MKKFIIILILVFLNSCKPQVNGEQSFNRYSNIPAITLKVNGKKSEFIIDSGASFSTIDRLTADKWGIKHFEIDNYIIGIGGKVKLSTTKSIDVVILGDTIKTSFRVADLEKALNLMKESSGVKFGGILGGDFLIANGCTIDYKENKLICGKW